RASPRNPLRSPLLTQRGGGRIAVPAGIRSRSTRVRAHACARPSLGPRPGCPGCRRPPCSRTRPGARVSRRAEGGPHRTSPRARQTSPTPPRLVDSRAWRGRGGSCVATLRLLRSYRPKTCVKFSRGCGSGVEAQRKSGGLTGGASRSPRSSQSQAVRNRHRVLLGVSALVEAATQTFLAAFLVDERRLSALLAEITDGLLRVVRRRCGTRLRRLGLADVLGQRPGDSVGQREDLRRPEPCRLPTADTRELADALLEPALSRERRREPQRERNQPAESFGDGHRVGAALADLCEDLEGLAFLRLVDRDVGRPDGRLHPVRGALEAVRAWL